MATNDQIEVFRKLNDTYFDLCRSVDAQGMRNTFGLTREENKDLSFDYEIAKMKMNDAMLALEDQKRKMRAA